jgi:hypothetical protein
MKTSRYTEAQILAILRQAEGGMPVAQLCREHDRLPRFGVLAGWYDVTAPLAPPA